MTTENSSLDPFSRKLIGFTDEAYKKNALLQASDNFNQAMTDYGADSSARYAKCVSEKNVDIAALNALDDKANTALIMYGLMSPYSAIAMYAAKEFGKAAANAAIGVAAEGVKDVAAYATLGTMSLVTKGLGKLIEKAMETNEVSPRQTILADGSKPPYPPGATGIAVRIDMVDKQGRPHSMDKDSPASITFDDRSGNGIVVTEEFARHGMRTRPSAQYVLREEDLKNIRNASNKKQKLDEILKEKKAEKKKSANSPFSQKDQRTMKPD